MSSSVRSRTGATMFVAAAAAVANPATAASPFTPDQCQIIVNKATQVISVYGPQNISSNFYNSILGFVSPDRATLTCDGSRDIQVAKSEDAAAFLTLRRELLGSNISLEQAGLRTIDVSGLRTADPAKR